ncbi:MAG: TatD family hydrolase [Candidatus Marsarchaeota archaeon]|nr:TatD family hydrolase [Candidatus Marsarchaeota archaeon]MCL5106304.1 TatD family hydrolase [Candidatus Marsarchaeota archaeon]
MQKEILRHRELKKQKTEMADAHCHLDLMENKDFTEFISYGVRTLITNGIDTKSNLETLNISDNRNIFPALGIDPQFALIVGGEELDFNIKLAKDNLSRIVAIGEIGLDFIAAADDAKKQKQIRIFERMLDLAAETHLPVSVHSRNSIKEVISVLEAKKTKKVHFHFFEGDLEDIYYIKKNNCMISVPPQPSARRMQVIKELPISNIMVESDAPAASKNPIYVENAIKMVSEIKGIDFERAAQIITANTKIFFNTKNKSNLNSLRK